MGKKNGKSVVEAKDESEPITPSPDPIQSEDKAPEKEVVTAVLEKLDREDNSGKLFLRNFFVNSEKSEKVVTKLNGKVYFPKDPHIVPGWYIASIIEERESYGVMDTMPISEVPISLWRQKVIRGVYVSVNHNENQLEIFRSIPADHLDQEESNPILVKPLPEPKYDTSNSIGSLIKSKLEQNNPKA